MERLFKTKSFSSEEKLSKSIKIMRILSGIVGFDILDPNYHFNLLSFIVVFDCVTYVFINAYDVKEFWGSTTQVCFCLVTWSFGFQVRFIIQFFNQFLTFNFITLQGMIRIAIFFGKRKTLVKFVQEVNDYTIKYGNYPLTTNIVQTYSSHIFLQIIFFTGLFAVVAVLSIVYPLPVIIFKGELLLPFGFIIPGLNYTTHPGFELNYAYQFMQVVFTTAGLGGAHMFNILFTLNGCLRLEIIMLKLREMEASLFKKEMIAPNQLHEADLTEIIQLHQDALEYYDFFIFF